MNPGQIWESISIITNDGVLTTTIITNDGVLTTTSPTLQSPGTVLTVMTTPECTHVSMQVCVTDTTLVPVAYHADVFSGANFEVPGKQILPMWNESEGFCPQFLLVGHAAEDTNSNWLHVDGNTRPFAWMGTGVV